MAVVREDDSEEIVENIKENLEEDVKSNASVHIEPQYQGDTEEEEETDDNAVSYRTNAIRIALDTEKPATAKIMAA